MSFPRYPEYKDSGVEWLREVPAHWEVLALKRVIQMRSGDAITSEQIAESGEFPVFGGNGIRGFCADFTHDGTYALVGRQGALCGNVNYASGRFWASEHAVVCSPLRTLETRWIGELLRAMNLGQYSVAAAQPGLSVDVISRLGVAVPPLEEQKGIAAFLDRETGKIDGLVAEQERLIELLREKRQAVISHAVTKGLNPDAPMKDSGVEWLGEVPAHWTLRRGRHLFRKLEMMPEPEDQVVTAFRDGQVICRANRRTEGFTIATLEVGYQRVRTGDLVVHGMDAFAGAVGVSESTGKCTPEYSVLEALDATTDLHYMAAALRLMALRDFVFVICPSVRERAPRFRFEALKDVWLPVPPVEEQREIMAMLTTSNKESSALITEAERAIELLRERRAALISAAVTGQIDVRHLAAGEPA